MIKRIRYVFTVVTHTQELPENPLEQRLFIEKIIKTLKEDAHADQVGVVAVLES